MNRRLLPLTAFLVTFPAMAQQDAAQAHKDFPFRVLQSKRVSLGDHSITLNRVIPPVLPVSPHSAVSPLQGEGGAAVQKVVRSAPRKKSEVLFLSATVRDHRLTEIRWVEDGQRWSAFSNIDFNLLTAAGNFESDDTVYSLLLTVQNEDTAPNGVPQGDVSGGQRPPTKQRQFPRLDIFSLTESQYLIVGDQPDGEPQAKMLAALDALHIHYDANRRRITDEYARREAGRIEQERMLRAHPPKPKDTVVNYWIGTKPVVPAGTTTGGRP